MRTKINIVNAVMFQCCWFTAVLASTYSALIILAISLSIYFYSLYLTEKRTPYMALLVTGLSFVGYMGDTLIAQQTGLIYSNSLGLFAPIWLLVLWIAFAATLEFSMKWVFTNPWVTVLVGLFLVPFSYFAGIHLSNSYFLEQHSRYTFFIIEGIWWATVLLSYRAVIHYCEEYYEKSIIT